MLKIGSVLDGKYKILSEIGHGGMSTVYMAINEKANKTWAVKEVRKSGVMDFEAVKQSLIVETDLLKRLRHPNLPTIVDVIEEEDVFLIVMDYVEGNSLRVLLEEQGSLPEDYVIEWAKQLLDVLSYLHAQTPPIIYRDMKPANIILKPDGNLSLIDFGTAREFKADKTEDTACLGTVGYAAPEQFGGLGQTDERTDIYGLGATLYHLLTGHNPSLPPYEIKPIRSINPNLSQGLENILLCATEKDPEQRYQNAEEFLYAISHVEESDERYYKKQRGKFHLFLFTLFLSGICFALGFSFLLSSQSKKEERYTMLLQNAEEQQDGAEKEKNYLEAANMPDMEGREEAYLGLIQSDKSDQVFSREEAGTLEELIRKNRAALLKHPEEYGDICFQLGKAFWYYYEGEDNAGRMERAKSAAPWFANALEYLEDGDSKKSIALVYERIGSFYRDIATNIVEASDQGMYKTLFEDFQTLFQEVAVKEEEGEMVRLELLEFMAESIEQYAGKMRADQVTRSAMEDALLRIEMLLPKISVNSELTEEKKKTLEETLMEAKIAVQNVFSQEEDKG